MKRKEIIERAKEIIKEETNTHFEVEYLRENEDYFYFEVILNEFSKNKQVRVSKEDFNIIEYNVQFNQWSPIEKI